MKYPFIFTRPDLWRLVILLGLVYGIIMPRVVNGQEESPPIQHLVQPGDTWTALAWRYGVEVTNIQAANSIINKQRQPIIGKMVSIPNSASSERKGRLVNLDAGGLLQQSAIHGISAWSLAKLNEIEHPYRPLLYRSVFLPGGMDPPRQFPVGFRSLELSQVPSLPGQGLAIRAQLDENIDLNASLSNLPMNTFTHNLNLVGLVGTGAFFPAGDHELSLQPEEKPLWSQPWHMIPGEWTFEEITLTGDAAAIDAESIRQERERLAMIWNQSSELPLWHAAFEQPIQQYLRISSRFGARRSYNGGPYQSYHEGVDYSAYAGTPVYAPASGTVVLAEKLYVRGGAVIIDHGLGIYSGLYHLSEVLVEPEEQLSEGQIIGRVGTTGLSTGNHLHWDLLVGGTWVDAAGWLDLNIACWILEGLEQTCDPA